MKKITEGQSELFNLVRIFFNVRREVIKNLDAKIEVPFLIHC